MAHLKNIRKGSWLKGLHINKDYEDIFSPIEKWGTIHTLLALVAQNGWKVHQMDMKTTFLNGDLKENVYISYPEGFVKKGQAHKVCKLIESLYGLKQEL